MQKNSNRNGKKSSSWRDQISQRAKALAADRDTLFPFNRFGEGSDGRSIPVIHIHRAAIDPAVKAALGSSLADLEKKIDEGPKPHSGELAGWRISG